MPNDKITIMTVATGESIERLMTDDEQAEHDAFLAEIKAEEKAKAAEAAQAAAHKAAATLKLEALGLTADDLKALGL